MTKHFQLPAGFKPVSLPVVEKPAKPAKAADKAVYQNRHIKNGEIDRTFANLQTLKTSDKGSELLFVDSKNVLSLWVVTDRQASRGREGSTKLALVNVITGRAWILNSTNSVPDGIVRISKVSSGLNSRTLARLDGAPSASAVPSAPSAPEAIPEPSVSAPESVADAMPEASVETSETGESGTDVAETDTPASAETAEMLEEFLAEGLSDVG